MAVFFDMAPRVAMLSYSNYGSVRNEDTQKVSWEVALVREKKPELLIDGEMQADTAVTVSILKEEFPFNLYFFSAASFMAIEAIRVLKGAQPQCLLDAIP